MIFMRNMWCSEVSFVNLAEEAKLNLAIHATAAAGERGVCTPRATEPIPSPRRPFRRPSQESCPGL